MPLTPMMRQYLQMKEENPGALLMFRLGDFYELFFEDAKVASKELELTLTGRDCGMPERAPMCGVPYHAVETYIARLVEKGYRVAVCDQMIDPALAKGLVDRSVTRVVSPGTITNPDMLDEHAPSYILALCQDRTKAGLAYCDVSTGEFFTYCVREGQIADEIGRIGPKEMLLCAEDGFRAGDCYVNPDFSRENFDLIKAKKALVEHFGRQPDALGLTEKTEIRACGALMRYLTDTQKNALGHIQEIRQYTPEKYMAIDPVARASLELTEGLRSRSRRGTLLSLLDKTVTAMGSRMLRSWIEQPLCVLEEIKSRADAVEVFVEDPMLRCGLREALTPVRDVERLLSRIAYETVNGRDCLSLAASLSAIPSIRLQLGEKDGMLRAVLDRLQPMDELADLLKRAISPDAPVTVKDGGVIAEGYSEELDSLRAASTDGKGWIAALEKQEREATGIKNLKIGFNHVFGFYIEVTKSNYQQVPDRYIRKQTLASAERYITEDLKELEKQVLGADENAVRLEYQLFVEIRDKLKANIEALTRVAEGFKTLDSLLSLAQCAAEYDYVRPAFNREGRYEIKNGRHPVVERALSGESFVPNDTHITREERVMIITGPNMAGKSTFMRQVALIVLMAHMGGFVPAESADISLTRQIFTRVGASDDLYSGQSTFMVEMKEMAYILRNARQDSLVLLDEVGRGTSTFDGLSIAWAATEYIADPEKCGAATLFATHYHELSELEGKLPGVVNYRISARAQGDSVVFLRKITRGGEDKSYGVAVAALAGLPQSLIARARKIMARLEVDDQQFGGAGKRILDKRKNGGDKQFSIQEIEPMELVEEIRALDVMSMSPIDALNKLFTLTEKARRI